MDQSSVRHAGATEVDQFEFRQTLEMNHAGVRQLAMTVEVQPADLRQTLEMDQSRVGDRFPPGQPIAHLFNFTSRLVADERTEPLGAKRLLRVKSNGSTKFLNLRDGFPPLPHLVPLIRQPPQPHT